MFTAIYLFHLRLCLEKGTIDWFGYGSKEDHALLREMIACPSTVVEAYHANKEEWNFIFALLILESSNA